MSTTSNTVIIAPTGGLKIVNNLASCYAKLIGTGSGSNAPITVNANTPLTMTLALAAGSSGITYSASTGMVTILVSGTYQVSIMFTLSAASNAFLEPLVNGSSVAITQGRCAQSNSSGSVVGTNLYNLTAGQTFAISFSATTQTTIANNPQDTFWYIRKIA